MNTAWHAAPFHSRPAAMGTRGWAQQAHLARARGIVEQARAEPATASWTSAGDSPANTSPAYSAAASFCSAGMACEWVSSVIEMVA